uniref:MFS domain-containing protein n=1 Tax=Strongyloides papillosus TaxID=174720 RepID=A0A0N5BDC9_STREA
MILKNYIKKGKKYFKRSVGEDETNWLSMLIASSLSFSAAVQYSVFFSSMWPFLTILDSNVTQSFFGYVVGAYSIGVMIFSPLFGYWSNRVGSIKYPLYAALISQLIGNIIYFNLENFSFGNKYWLFISRIFIGIGSSQTSLFKSYGAAASSKKDRTKALAIVTGGFSIGMTIGPAFNLMFTPIGYPGIRVFGININMYTLPGLVGVITNFVSIFIIFFLFKEHYAGVINKEEHYAGVINKEGKKTENYQNIPKADKIAIVIVNLTRFCQLLIISSLEAITSPLSLMIFGMTRLDSINACSVAHGFLGLNAFAVYFVYILFKLEKYFQFRNTIIVGICGLIFFHLSTYPYPFMSPVLVYNSTEYEDMKFFNETEPVGCDVDKFSWCNYMTMPVSPLYFFILYGSVIVGCDVDKFSWCNYMTMPVSPLYFFILYGSVIGISFPLINVSMNTLFSQILGPRRQGTQTGLVGFFGGLGQLVGPVIFTTLYSNYGPRVVWGSTIGMICVVLSSWIIFYRRMVSLKYETTKI